LKSLDVGSLFIVCGDILKGLRGYQPVLDCETIFHPDCGGRDFPSTIFENTSLWRLNRLVTLSLYK